MLMKIVNDRVTSISAFTTKSSPKAIHPNKDEEDIKIMTKNLSEIKIEIRILVQNRNCKICVLSTSTSLIIETLKESLRDRKKAKHM